MRAAVRVRDAEADPVPEALSDADADAEGHSDGERVRGAEGDAVCVSDPVCERELVVDCVVVVVPDVDRDGDRVAVDETVGVADVDRVAVEFGVLDCVDVPVAVALVVGVTD